MKKKPAAIPLEALLDTPGFDRNCEILLSEPVAAPSATDSSRARKAITSLVISGAVDRAKSKRQHVTNSQKGGAASVQSRRSELALRNKTIAEDARRKLALWRYDYNNIRPHSSLANRTPAETRRALEQVESSAPGPLAQHQTQGYQPQRLSS